MNGDETRTQLIIRCVLTNGSVGSITVCSAMLLLLLSLLLLHHTILSPCMMQGQSSKVE